MKTTTKERPILFSGESVRAILAGRKTQTRRVITPPVPTTFRLHCVDDPRDTRGTYQFTELSADAVKANWAGEWAPRICPYGQPGDRLWVRETFAVFDDSDEGKIRRGYVYRADEGDDCEPPPPWRPSIFMPRSASRLTLEIVAVRVERVQEISEEDARAEGMGRVHPTTEILGEYRIGFREVWDSINAKRPGCAWKDNPWCWVIEFKRTEAK